MSNDASLPPNAPIVNGFDQPPLIHGEEDASPRPAAAPTSASSLEAVCEDMHRRVTAFLKKPPDSDLTRRVQEQTKVSIGVIETALNEYDFSSLSLSYNGGKDCLVLLILYLSTLHTHFKPGPSATTPTRKPSFPTSIQSIYAESPDPFPSITNFVTCSSKRYHLDLHTIRTNPRPDRHDHNQPSKSPPTQNHPQNQNHNHTAEPTSPSSPHPSPPEKRITFRDAFAIYLSSSSSSSSNHNPNHHPIRAIFVGTRRTDPHGAHLTHFDRTDHGWPDFMRIHPVIDWRLSEIWCFLRADELGEPGDNEDGDGDGGDKHGDGPRRRRLAYCDMYDEGYTSLGGVGDTLRNPRLRYVDAEGRERYRPAYELTEDGEERLGRE